MSMGDEEYGEELCTTPILDLKFSSDAKYLVIASDEPLKGSLFIFHFD